MKLREPLEKRRKARVKAVQNARNAINNPKNNPKNNIPQRSAPSSAGVGAHFIEITCIIELRACVIARATVN